MILQELIPMPELAVINLLSLSEIADFIEEPPQRVAYIIRKLRIKPKKRIGIIRLFSKSQAIQIKQGCFNMQVRR